MEAIYREVLLSFWKVHILHHASEGPIHGQWVQTELRRHGYEISPGTLYPLLHGLEKKGYLKGAEHRDGKSLRRVYRATPFGRKALKAAKEKVRELFGEVVGES